MGQYAHDLHSPAVSSAPAPGTDVEAELAARLRLAVMRLARRLRGQTEGGVSASQLSALSSLGRCGPLTLGELSAVERVRPPTMTRVVASLEEMGMVTRTVDPADRRVARVDVTDLGRRFINSSRHRKDAYLASRLHALSADDRSALDQAAEILERLMDTPE